MYKEILDIFVSSSKSYFSLLIFICLLSFIIFHFKGVLRLYITYTINHSWVGLYFINFKGKINQLQNNSVVKFIIIRVI